MYGGYCPELAPYYCQICAEIFNGGIRSAAIYDRTINPILDPTSNAEWAQLACNRKAVIIPQVRGSLTTTVQENPGYDDVKQIVTGHSFVATIVQQFNIDNRQFFVDITNNPNRYGFAWVTGFSGRNAITWVANSKSISFSAKVDIVEDINSILEYTIMVKWEAQDSINLSYKGEADKIFRDCKTLEDYLTFCNPVCTPIIPVIC